MGPRSQATLTAHGAYCTLHMSTAVQVMEACRVEGLGRRGARHLARNGFRASLRLSCRFPRDLKAHRKDHGLLCISFPRLDEGITISCQIHSADGRHEYSTQKDR